MRDFHRTHTQHANAHTQQQDHRHRVRGHLPAQADRQLQAPGGVHDTVDLADHAGVDRIIARRHPGIIAIQRQQVLT